MSVWGEVQEALYERWKQAWVNAGEPATPFCFEDEAFDPPDALWVRFSVKRRPGGEGTMGAPGRRRMDRVGVVFIQLFVPPGDGVALLSDAAERAAKIFENCRMGPHDVRFAVVEPGDAFDSDQGRYRAVVVEGRFDYEDYS